VLDWFFESLGPDLQDMAFAIVIIVIGGLGTMDEPAPRDRARDHAHDLLQAALDLVAHHKR
jgi:hypothetical protein